MGTDRKQIKAVSPADFVNQISIPVLLIHGVNDWVVPIGQSREMAQRMRDAGKLVELVELQGAGHGLEKDQARIEMLSATEAFLRKHLPPGPSPATQ